MAIATLERCYNNPDVFCGVVKIRKGEAVRLMMEATSIGKVRAIFKHFLSKVRKTQNMYHKQIEAETKWPTFCKHLHIYFLVWKLWYFFLI